MEYITMRNGTKVPMLGLGCYKSEEQEGVEAVKSAIEIGYRHIDTANFYENEKYVGRGIRESGIDREKLFVVSKIWPTSFKTPEVAIEYSMRALNMAKKRGYINTNHVDAATKVKYFVDAIPSLFLIVIIIGGILSGIFTATEASGVAVAYALILGFIYKSIKAKDLPKIILDSARTTVIIVFLIGVSSIMSWIMAYTEIPTIISNAMLTLTNSKVITLLIINVVLLFVGTFMDPTPAILIFTPIFLPICTGFGMSSLQFGIMIVYNLCIGAITPPVGSVLFTGCKVGKVTIEQVIKTLLPFFVAIILVLMIVTYVPAVSEFLPRLNGYI